MTKLIRILAAIAAATLITATVLVVYDFFQARGNFPYRTYVGKIEVSGLSQPQAAEKLNRFQTSQVFSPLITFEGDSLRLSFTPEAIGISVDINESIKKAFYLTHDDGYVKELKKRLSQKGIFCPLVFKINEEILKNFLTATAALLGTTPKDASIILFEESGGYHIESEELGKEVQIEDTIKTFKNRLALGYKNFPIIIKYESPRVTEKILRTFPPAYRLSAYTTYYGRHDSPNRIHNIKLIASWLDGTLLMPNDTLSLADAIGEFTPERGFKEAFVIYGGVLVPQLGGGTCQIGTTLFNAASLADLEILKRSNHSFYFNIYPLGRDATVYPGQKDLLFRNNTGHPVLIKAVATNKRLSFRVYGTPTGKKVLFSAPSVFMLTASGYHPSTVNAVLAADAPFKTVVTRTVYDAAGNKLKEELLHSSYKLYGEKTNVPIARPEPR